MGRVTKNESGGRSWRLPWRLNGGRGFGPVGAKKYVYGIGSPFVLCLSSSLAQAQQAAFGRHAIEHGKKQFGRLVGVVLTQFVVAHGMPEANRQTLQHRAGA